MAEVLRASSRYTTAKAISVKINAHKNRRRKRERGRIMGTLMRFEQMGVIKLGFA